MVKIRVFKKGDPEWLKMRARFLTATEVGTIFGVNSYQNPTKMMAEKIESTFRESVFTVMGKILEPAVLNSYGYLMDTEDIHLFSEGGKENVIYYDEKLRLSATPDAYVGLSPEEIRVVVELKATSHLNLIKWSMKESLPFSYLLQLSTQCILLNHGLGHLSGMAPVYPTLPAICIELDCNKELKDFILEEVRGFWDIVDAGKSFSVSSKTKSKAISLLKSHTNVVAERGLNTTTSKQGDIKWDPL